MFVFIASGFLFEAFIAGRDDFANICSDDASESLL